MLNKIKGIPKKLIKFSGDEEKNILLNKKLKIWLKSRIYEWREEDPLFSFRLINPYSGLYFGKVYWNGKIWVSSPKDRPSNFFPKFEDAIEYMEYIFESDSI